MRKLIVSEWMSLDGVVQAPILKEEDRSGGFRHGGWHFRYFDDVSMRWVEEAVARAGGYVLGRGTYQQFAAYWPHASEAEQVLARPLNEKPKYVASRTLAGPLGWRNSHLLGHDVVAELAALKAQPGGDLYVIGSPVLARALLSAGAVDELRLMIDPLVLGGGKRMFPEDGTLSALRLVEHQVTSTGATLSTYARA